jgi:hypothetical protein
MSDNEILAIYGIGPAYLVKIKNTFIVSGLFAVCTLDLSITYSNKSFSDKLEGIYSTFTKESYTWLASRLHNVDLINLDSFFILTSSSF